MCSPLYLQYAELPSPASDAVLCTVLVVRFRSSKKVVLVLSECYWAKIIQKKCYKTGKMEMYQHIVNLIFLVFLQIWAVVAIPLGFSIVKLAV